MYITICETDYQSKFDAWNRALKAGALGQPRGMGWGRREEGTHVHLWLIHLNVWQKPPQYCKVTSFQLKKQKQNKNTRVGSYSLLQAIFPIQRLNLGLLHCRQILYHQSHQGSHQNQWLWNNNLNHLHFMVLVELITVKWIGLRIFR